mmetsp:Transcript_9370/g.26266  ORF Transcript_9370/g.26266 Transcript_9370/m.26266 type:complete len:264 (+) Transcript_9370:778-1569(+)
MGLDLPEELHEAELRAAAHGEVAEGLRVEQLARHRDVGVHGGEPLLGRPRVRELVAATLAVPGLVLVVHHPEEVGADLVVADPPDLAARDGPPVDVHQVLLVGRGLHHIRGAQEAVHDADLDLVLDVVVLQVRGDRLLQHLGRDLLVAVQALHEGLGPPVLVLHALQDSPGLGQQLEAHVTVLLELLRDVLFRERVRELWGHTEITAEEGLHRLFEVCRPQAQQQGGPRGWRLFLGTELRSWALYDCLAQLARPCKLFEPCTE